MDDWIKNKLEKMDNKLDRMDQRLDNLDITSAKQNVILEDHTRRSLANEKAVELLKEEIKPIQKERYMIKGGAKLIAIAVSSIGVIAGIVKYLVSM